MSDSTPDLAELLADVRRRCRAADREEARPIADLPDQDLLWLLANHWQPPDPVQRAARPAGRSWAFKLTVEQHERYQQAVARAQEVKLLLQRAEVTGDGRLIAELRLRLQDEARKIRAMSEEWRPS